MEETYNRSKILLETGTNELEIMVFTIYGELYGINVAKVKEIMMSNEVKPMPHAHPSIEGIFKPRGTLMTVVDLPLYLTGRETEKKFQGFIYCNRIQQDVHSLSGKHRGGNQPYIMGGYPEAR